MKQINNIEEALLKDLKKVKSLLDTAPEVEVDMYCLIVKAFDPVLEQAIEFTTGNAEDLRDMIGALEVAKTRAVHALIEQEDQENVIETLDILEEKTKSADIIDLLSKLKKPKDDKLN